MRNYLLLTVFMLPVLQACTPAPEAGGAYPAPGTLRMISVERVEEGGASALLPNGAFEEWHGGLPAPTGFRAPSAASESTLLRDAKAGHLGATGYTARQTWTGPGSSADPAEAFGATVQLKPNTNYRLEAIASATAGMGAAISAVEAGQAAGSRVIARSVLEVRGEAPARYTGTFTTLAGGEVILSSRALGDSTLPGSVIWSAWRLEEAEEAIEAVNIADRPERRALVNQALDQIRSQVALYGGAEAWGAATDPNRKNAARIVREEGAKGESILGYDQYVSGKSELAWFETVTAPAPDGVAIGGPAREAILRGERALNARGIQVIVVPIPERVQLYFDQIYRPSAQLPMNLAAHAMFVEGLLAKDVLVLDPAPLLRAMKAEGKPVYWRGDPDVPSATLQALAEQVAPVLSALGAEVPEGQRRVYTLKVDTIALEQRLVPGLPAEFRDSIAREVHAVQSVRDEAGELFQSAPGSPVLAAGSLAALHQVRGASFAAHLSRLLGFPIALPGKNLPDTEILAYLASGNAPEMASAKFVVFCIPEMALSREGWK